jgi:hypothetical protein
MHVLSRSLISRKVAISMGTEGEIGISQIWEIKKLAYYIYF